MFWKKYLYKIFITSIFTHRSSNISSGIDETNPERDNKKPATVATCPQEHRLKSTSHILVLDEDAFTHEVVHNTLYNFDPSIHIYSFLNGDEALEFSEEYPLDLILFGVRDSPSGWEILKRMAGLDKKIELILLINDSNEDMLPPLNKYPKIKGTITKPINKDDLLDFFYHYQH